MPVESADDLAGFFDPDEFGDELVLVDGLTSTPFNGIYTDAPVADQPGSTPTITVRAPRVIASRAAVVGVQQGSRIERAGTGDLVGVVNDIAYKGAMVVLALHDEAW